MTTQIRKVVSRGVNALLEESMEELDVILMYSSCRCVMSLFCCGSDFQPILRFSLCLDLEFEFVKHLPVDFVQMLAEIV